jgi:hypothetical protein
MKRIIYALIITLVYFGSGCTSFLEGIIPLLTINKLQKLFFNIVHCLPFVTNAN